MSQQINLINPALRKKRDWLSAVPISIMAGAILALLLTVSIFARQQADTLQADADKRVADLKAAQGRLLEMGKTMSDLKPNQELVDELGNARAVLNLREEVISALEGGAFRNSKGFSEYLRGFARQVPTGLWLSGFTLNSGGAEMVIRGRMLNATALPEYIRRLNGEKVFQGRSFSSLIIQRPTEDTGGKPVATTPGAPATAPQVMEFVLRTTIPEADRAAAQAVVKPSAASAQLEIKQ